MDDKLAKTNTIEDANLRKIASTESDIIQLIPKNEKVFVTSLEKDWSKVISQGKTGYVSTQYLNVDSKLIASIYEITYKESLIAGAIIPFLMIWFVFWVVGIFKSTVTDRRYKSGSRTDQAILNPILRKGVYYGFLAAMICVLPLSLIFWIFDIEVIHSILHWFYDFDFKH